MLLKEYVVGLQFLTIYDIYYTYNPNTNRYYLRKNDKTYKLEILDSGSSVM